MHGEPHVLEVSPHLDRVAELGDQFARIDPRDPAAEYPAVALTLDAELEALSPRGRRTIPATKFFTAST